MALNVLLRFVPTREKAAIAANRDQCRDQRIFDSRDPRRVVNEISQKFAQRSLFSHVLGYTQKLQRSI